MTRPNYSSVSGRGRSTSSRGRSVTNIGQKSITSKLVSNTSPELGMPPCTYPNFQASEGNPSITQSPLSPPATQPPLTPHVEESTHASEGQLETTEGQSNDSNNVGPPWSITTDSVVIDYEVKKVVHELVQGHYKEAWTGWGKVPRDVRQRMFTAFRGIYTWESQHEPLILCHFNHEASEWLKKHLYLARTLYKAPLEWMTPSVWESLQIYWGTEEFKKKSEQNKKNRAVNGTSSTVIYRGGSVSTAVHRLRLIEELGREPTPKECFIRTHGKKDGTLEGGRAIQIVEQFDKALADKCDHGEDENSINQNELWDRIAVGSRNKVLGKGNIIRQMSSINHKPRWGPSQSNGQLHDQIKELQTELARTRTEHDEMRVEHDAMRAELETMRIEWASRESFETTLLAALQLKGIDLSDMLTRSVRKASTTEAQSHVDEHSPMPKRPRTTVATDNPYESQNDEDDLC